MFNKDIFRLLQCDKFPIVNPDDVLATVVAINLAESLYYPHSVVAHLLSLVCRLTDVHTLEYLVFQSVKCGWRPYREDASHYEKLCIYKIVAIIDNYEKKNN